MTCGIYRITEKETGRHYIGQSIDIERRWRHHRKRFSPDLFSYHIVMTCLPERDILNYWERFCIADFGARTNGFNIQKCKGGWNYSSKGRTFSKEHCQKLSESNKHAKHAGHGAAVSAAKKGKPWTDTQRQAMKLAWEKKKNAN